MKKPKLTDADAPRVDEIPDKPGTVSKDAREKLSAVSSGDVEEDLRKLAKDRTKTLKVSKVARDAQDQLDMMQILEPTLAALNEVAAERWPEFRHTEEELKAIRIAASRVAIKYLDLALYKYQDEIILATVLGTGLLHKGMKYHHRVKEEKAKEKKSEKIQTGQPDVELPLDFEKVELPRGETSMEQDAGLQ